MSLMQKEANNGEYIETKRDRMLAFLEELKKTHSDDASIRAKFGLLKLKVV